MKNKEVVSAIVGTTFFALPYLGLSVAILPSIAIGAAAYGASELILGGTKKKKLVKKRFSDIINEARKENEFLLRVSKQIENLDTANNLIEIANTVDKIIASIQQKPERMKKIDHFFDYYLPILLKIVRRYDEIENQDITSKDSTTFIKSADDMIKRVNISFKKMLAGLYQSDIVDADAEMKVFNSMLNLDGLNAEIDLSDKEK